MFQNRLKIVMVALLVVTVGLMLRALQLQVVDREEWVAQAAKVLAPPAQLIETTRGRILDFKGREVAVDRPCVDLCVDYRAIAESVGTTDPAVEKWVKGIALARLKNRMGEEYTKAGKTARLEMLAAEMEAVKGDIGRMWGVIAAEGGKSLEEIGETRRDIVQRVEMRRRYVWVSRWRAAVSSRKELPQAPWYRRWMMGESGGDEIQLDSFDLSVGEQTAAYVILADVGEGLINYFGKEPELYPGLVLRPGIKRVYPYEEAGCHLIGHMSKVTREDLAGDDDLDELRKYWPNDVAGKTGVEALAEPVLRGSRGRMVKGEEVTKPKAGEDVRLSVDIELQREIQGMFKKVAIGENKEITYHAMHGAAVVIDVPTGEVRAMASYPDYDLNKMDEEYGKLAGDELGLPLLNRATQVAREPGSTAKPMVGLGAMTAGLIAPTGTIECRGYLYIDGKKQSVGRCWTASRYERLYPDLVAHHQIPTYDPHPTGFLTMPDALERSCNVFFETLGDRLKIEGLTRVFHEFGLGRHTGVGIAEVTGYVPGDFPILAEMRRYTSWFCAIGQLRVAATPLQMAQVAATIGRGGVWMKPRLVSADTPLPAGKPTTQPSEKDAPGDDVMDLHLSPVALREVKEGMLRVVYDLAGTGRMVAHVDGDNAAGDRSVEDGLEPALAHLRICGKTGTAQASRIKVPVRDGEGKVVLDGDGKEEMEYLKPTLPGENGGATDWYRATNEKGDNFNHAWFIGFVPADKPKLAFAVMVEYGENGGGTAGRLAKHVIEACVEHGYLPAGDKGVAMNWVK
jgi:penicillin-binding protein 2